MVNKKTENSKKEKKKNLFWNSENRRGILLYSENFFPVFQN